MLVSFPLYFLFEIMDTCLIEWLRCGLHDSNITSLITARNQQHHHLLSPPVFPVSLLCHTIKIKPESGYFHFKAELIANDFQTKSQLRMCQKLCSNQESVPNVLHGQF